MSQADDDSLSPIAPLRLPVFRMLWTTWLMANICMWMSEVAAAWMMTSLTTKPLWVALVQTAATLPVFLLGLPSGALADNLDRKRYFLFTQLWVAAVASLLSVVIFLDVMTPPLLLVLIFANGIGMAMRWPVFSAIVPELVPRSQLPAALGLNGVSMNASRIIGPLVAGALIASAGSAWVFLFNALLSIGAAIIISRWKREHTPNPLGRERLGSAMRVGLQYVAQSYLLKGVLLRISIFFFHSTALMALLALIARGMQDGGAGTFTLLLAAMGAGAITSTAFLPRLRRRYSRDGLVLRGAAVQATAMAVMAVTHQLWIAVPAMFLGGAAWITVANTLSVSIQMGLPDWVRARGGIPVADAQRKPARPAAPRRPVLGIAARHQRPGPLRRGHRRRVVDGPPAPLRPRHRRRRRAARPQARLSPRRRTAARHPLPDGNHRLNGGAQAVQRSIGRSASVSSRRASSSLAWRSASFFGSPFC